jgi:L-malate glycosyltransferase
MSRREIDDAQAAMCERRALVEKHSGIVGSTVRDQVAHPDDAFTVVNVEPVEGNEPSDSAHARWPSGPSSIAAVDSRPCSRRPKIQRAARELARPLVGHRPPARHTGTRRAAVLGMRFQVMARIAVRAGTNQDKTSDHVVQFSKGGATREEKRSTVYERGFSTAELLDQLAKRCGYVDAHREWERRYHSKWLLRGCTRLEPCRNADGSAAFARLRPTGAGVLLAQLNAMPSPLRVALVAPTLGILGGQAVQADRLVNAWRGDGAVEAWLVPINPMPPRPLKPLLNVKFVRTLLTQLLYWPLLVRELRRADVVHVFSASYFSFLLAPLPALLIARWLGKPVVLNYRSGEAPDHLARSGIARRALRAVDMNVVPSTFLQDVFRRFGIRATVIPNIVDVDRFAFRLRAPLRPRILSTRNFEPLYNVACTLKAFALVQRAHPDATLTLVGSGSQDEALRRLAGELGLRNVQFAGRVPSDDIWRYYADADVYLQTPDIDNMPGSILEAFASGCAVVATAAGGVPAILRDDVHGCLVPCGDHVAAGEQIIELLEDSGRAQRLTTAARESCAEYQWSRVREKWVFLYRSVCGCHGPDADQKGRATSQPESLETASVFPEEASRSFSA